MLLASSPAPPTALPNDEDGPKHILQVAVQSDERTTESAMNLQLRHLMNT